MNTIDRLVAWFSPERAVRRMAARSALAYYEGAEPSRLRKFHRERGTANQLVRKAAKPLRDQARHGCSARAWAEGAAPGLRATPSPVVCRG